MLNELYAPLVRRLTEAGGTLGKLSFSVTRVADVAKWAKQGEDELFDLRGDPFKGIGSLEKEANLMLRDAWRTGDSAAVSAAMTRFREKHQEALLEKAPYPRTDRSNYRPWSRCFAPDELALRISVPTTALGLRRSSAPTSASTLARRLLHQHSAKPGSSITLRRRAWRSSLRVAPRTRPSLRHPPPLPDP